ncbi:MAG TPA: beta-phosphoglucomutase, partial [Sphingomonas sp.]
MAFRAAIFDLDGVLVDSARLHFIAWKRIADELGIGFDEQANEALKGVDRMGSLDHILMLGGRSLDTVAREELAARKNGYYLDALASMTEADVLP